MPEVPAAANPPELKPLARAHAQVGALLQLRSQINSSLADSGVKLSVNDFVVKAAALALRKVCPAPVCSSSPVAFPAQPPLAGARGCACCGCCSPGVLPQ